MKKLKQIELKKTQGGLAVWVIVGLVFLGAVVIGYVAGRISKRKG